MRYAFQDTDVTKITKTEYRYVTMYYCMYTKYLNFVVTCPRLKSHSCTFGSLARWQELPKKMYHREAVGS